MAVESKTFPGVTGAPLSEIRLPLRSLAIPATYERYFTWAQIILVFLFLEFSLWTPAPGGRNRWIVITTLTILLFALVDRPSLERLGLRLPKTFGASVVLGISFAAAMLMVLAVHWAGGVIRANPTWPNVHLAWQYLIWAMIQEFMLQSFFFTRCERLFGGPTAVWVTATLFAVAHLPSPILTTFTLIGALFFCEMFRRYRSIYPIGIVHALLGLTVSVTMPNSLLHHMRVGFGYLRF
jgi:membrane protease YdiL (CAAX protease family)